MAVVGEAHIIVRAITTKVKDDIKKGFDGVDDTITNTGQRARKMFQDDFVKSSAGARAAWTRLVRTSYILQGAVGTLAAALGSVIGGIGALAGAAGGAAGSIGAFAGVIAALPAGMATFKLALSGVGAAVSKAVQNNKNYSKSLQDTRDQLKQIAFDAEAAALSVRRAGLSLEQARENLLAAQQLPPNSRARREAELAYEEADLAYRRAQEQAEAAEKAKKKAAAGPAGEDPFADLNASQEKFARYLVTLQPLIKKLKESASSALLPILQDQIDRLVDGSKGAATFFEVINNGIKRTSTGLGSGVTAFVDALTNPKNLNTLKDVFTGIQPVFETMGKVFGSLFGSFLTITKAALPATQKLLGFIESKAKVFENFLDTKAKSGELTAFFNRATKLAGDFGQVFGNIGDFIGDVIESNFGPQSGGQYMINVLKQSTLRLRNLREEMGATKMDDYFYQASINARSVLGIIGDMGKGLAELGAMSEIQVTFQKLREAGPYVSKWLAEGAKLGPVMADIVVQIARFMSVFSESGNVLNFFSTIRSVVKIMADIMQNQVIAAIIGIISKIAAFGLAVKTIGTLFSFIFGKVIIGGIMSLVQQFKNMGAAFAAAKTGAVSLGTALKTMGPPILIVISTIVLALMEIGAEAQRNREAVLGTLEEINAMARSTATGGMDLLNKSFGEISGTIEYTRNLSKNGAFNSFAESFDTAKITKDAKTFKTAIAVATEATVKFNGEINEYSKNSGQIIGIGENTIETVQKAFENLGNGLADLARTDVQLFSTKFKEIAGTMQLSDDDVKRLLKTTPQLKNALLDAAGAANLMTDDQTLLNIALGRGDDYAAAVATQLYGVDGAAKAAKEEIDRLKNKIFDFGTVELDTRAASRSFQEAIDGVTESIIENGKGLDDSTEAGRANNAALDALVQSGKDYADSVFEQNGNTEELQANMIKLRDRVAAAAEKMGLGKKEAQDLADTLVGNKFEIQMSVKGITKKQAETATAELRKVVQDAGKAGFRVTAEDLARLYPDLVKQAATLNKRNGGYINAFSAGVRRFAPGGPVFGAGTGTSDSIPAMLSNGEFVVNANATAKNRSLLEQINSGNKSAETGGNVSIVVNAAPGMDVNELVNEVSRKVAFNMRKGASS